MATPSWRVTASCLTPFKRVIIKATCKVRLSTSDSVELCAGNTSTTGFYGIESVGGSSSGPRGPIRCKGEGIPPPRLVKVGQWEKPVLWRMRNSDHWLCPKAPKSVSFLWLAAGKVADQNSYNEANHQTGRTQVLSQLQNIPKVHQTGRTHVLLNVCKTITINIPKVHQVLILRHETLHFTIMLDDWLTLKWLQ